MGKICGRKNPNICAEPKILCEKICGFVFGLKLCLYKIRNGMRPFLTKTTLVCLLIADLCYSFFQYREMAFDGDMPQHIVPADNVKPVLADPLAVHAFKTHEKLHNPNRFFSHLAMFSYFNAAPKFFQKFTTPIESAYLSSAVFKTVAHVFLLFLLAFAVSGRWKIWQKDFLIAAALIAPLFQANGYANYMAVVDRAPTYAFFYSIPCIFMLVYLMPLISEFFHGKKKPLFSELKFLWLPLAFVTCLSGPLNPGIVLVLCLVLFLEKMGSANSVLCLIKSIPKNYCFFLGPLFVLSAYSLFIGQFNSMNDTSQLPLIELYSRLPFGIFFQFTQKPGFPLLFLAIAVNWFLLKKDSSPKSSFIQRTIKWVLLFDLFFILLLPLGGQREYRPNILRYDTIMPVTLGLMFIFGISTQFLATKPWANRRFYLPFVGIILLIYMMADKPDFHQNDCEKSAIELISKSREQVVPLDCDCTVLTWKKAEKPEDSIGAGALLFKWKITDEPKRFFNRK